MGDAGEDFQRLRRFVSVLRGAWPSRAGDANAAAASTLQLAERAADALTRPPAPAHVAVVGPTQVGKSSVVNHMLGVEAADVSPLAGHTTQAHGFQAGGAALTDWLASAFPDFAVKPSGELSREERRVIGFQRVRADFEADVVVWDTPDFDSAESAAYRAVTIDLIGLCDAVVLVVSREKYADLTVWTLLEQIAPLARELYICLNKVTPDAEAAIRASLMSRLQERLGAFDDSRVVTIPQSASIEAQRESTGTRMLRVVARNLSASDLQSRARRDIAAMSRTNWDVWTGPIVAEHAARETWHADVERALDVGFEHY
ncbi:MAG: GTPase domain-containing protein, partial [Phycisphaerales bacterium]|nr:GTPase domain-containing protein [Phycisphaerales bacterium]